MKNFCTALNKTSVAESGLELAISCQPVACCGFVLKIWLTSHAFFYKRPKTVSFSHVRNVTNAVEGATLIWTSSDQWNHMCKVYFRWCYLLYSLHDAYLLRGRFSSFPHRTLSQTSFFCGMSKTLSFESSSCLLPDVLNLNLFEPYELAPSTVLLFGHLRFTIFYFFCTVADFQLSFPTLTWCESWCLRR